MSTTFCHVHGVGHERHHSTLTARSARHALPPYTQPLHLCVFFVDGSLDDSFMLVSLMVVPGHVDVVLYCLLDGICK